MICRLGTVTTVRYLDMLTHCAIPEMQRQNTLSEIVWTQDGAPLHLGSSVKRLLNQQFCDRIISRYFSVFVATNVS